MLPAPDHLPTEGSPDVQLGATEPSHAAGAPHTPVDYERLVAALRAGDQRAAFDTWKAFSPRVEGILRRFFGPGPDRQDLSQEVFLRLFRRIQELEAPHQLPNFVCGITLGVARNALRRARLRAMVGLTAEGTAPETPALVATPETREAVHRLYVVLNRLSPEDRSLFVARFVERMELGELAAAHGFSVATAKRRLARTTKRLAARLAGDPALAELVSGLGRSPEARP